MGKEATVLSFDRPSVTFYYLVPTKRSYILRQNCSLELLLVCIVFQWTPGAKWLNKIYATIKIFPTAPKSEVKYTSASMKIIKTENSLPISCQCFISVFVRYRMGTLVRNELKSTSTNGLKTMIYSLS